MSENNSEHYVKEYNALVIAYAKLHDRATVAQIERIAILLESKALNARFDSLRKAQYDNNFSPDFIHMVESLGRTDDDFEGNVKALMQSYNPDVR
jgi:hypothetical protein